MLPSVRQSFLILSVEHWCRSSLEMFVSVSLDNYNIFLCGSDNTDIFLEIIWSMAVKDGVYH